MAINADLGTLTVDITTDTSGLVAGTNKAKKALGSTDKAVKQSAKTWGGFQAAIISAGAAFSVSAVTSKLIKFTDASISMNNKLKLATKSTADLNKVTKELFNTANETGSSIESTVELYAKMERATRDLGVGQDRLLNITNSINKAFSIGGATTAEAAGSIRQLGQALASGVLRGDEFNSIAEQAPIIMEAIQKSTGKTTGELRKLAEQGAITSDIVIKSLEKYKAKIDGDFATATKTFGQKLEIAGNQAIEFVGNNDAIKSAVLASGSAIVFASENLDILTTAITVAGIAFTGRLIGPIVATNAALLVTKVIAIRAASSVGILAASATAARSALAFLGGPAGALIVAAASLAAFIDWESDTEKQTKETTKEIDDQVRALKGLNTETEIAAANKSFSKRQSEVSEQIKKQIERIDKLKKAMIAAASSAKGTGFSALSGHLEAANEQLDKLFAKQDKIQELGAAVFAKGPAGILADTDISGKDGGLIDIGGGQTDKQKETAIKKREALKAASEATLQDLRNSFATEAELEDTFHAEQLEKLKEASAQRLLLGEDDFTVAMDAQSIELDLIKTHEEEKTRIAKEESEKRSDDAKKEQLSKIRNAQMGANALIALTDAFGSKSEKQQKRLRRAQVVVDTAAGVMKAFATSTDIYSAIALSALVVSQGKKSLDSINSGKALSGGRSSVPTITPPQPQQAQGSNGPDRAVQINLTGSASSLFTTEDVRNLIEQINEQVGDGVQIGIAGA